MNKIFGYVLTAVIVVLSGCDKSEAGKEASERMMALYGENRELPAQDSTSRYAVRSYNGFLLVNPTRVW